MSKFKTAKERKRRRRAFNRRVAREMEAKREKRRSYRARKKQKAAGVEIISQHTHQVGGVAVTFTIGRITSSKDQSNGG